MRPRNKLRWVLPVAALLGGIGIVAFGLHGDAPVAEPSATHDHKADGHDPHGRGCAADIAYPLELRVIALDDAAPGAQVTARIEVDARSDFEAVHVRVDSPPAVKTLTASAIEFGALRGGETRNANLTVELPAGTARQTVPIVAEAWHDGVRITRTTILNLLPGGGEPSRTVTRPDGRRIREVAAGRIGS
jgi:hypothetical protein